MNAQLDTERQALLERKRREAEEARKRQEELEQILLDNKLKVREGAMSKGGRET